MVRRGSWPWKSARWRRQTHKHVLVGRCGLHTHRGHDRAWGNSLTFTCAQPLPSEPWDVPHRGRPPLLNTETPGTSQGSVCRCCTRPRCFSCCRTAVSCFLSVFDLPLTFGTIPKNTKLPKLTSHFSFHLFFLVSFASAPVISKSSSPFHYIIMMTVMIMTVAISYWLIHARYCPKHFTYVISSTPFKIHEVLTHFINEDPRHCEGTCPKLPNLLLSLHQSQNIGYRLCIFRTFIQSGVCVFVCVFMRKRERERD